MRLSSRSWVMNCLLCACVEGVNACVDMTVRYQIASGEEFGTVRAAGPKSSRCLLPYVAMMKTTNPRLPRNFRTR